MDEELTWEKARKDGISEGRIRKMALGGRNTGRKAYDQEAAEEHGERSCSLSLLLSSVHSIRVHPHLLPIFMYTQEPGREPWTPAARYLVPAGEAPRTKVASLGKKGMNKHGDNVAPGSK
jgi:hypothetical protein